MKLSVSDLAKQMLQAKNDNDMVPTICLERGGCAGTMLVLKMMPKSDDTMITNGVAIANDVAAVTNDITIDVKGGLCRNIVVTNNAAAKTCRCGKSFVAK